MDNESNVNPIQTGDSPIVPSKLFVAMARSLSGLPYIWDGKNESGLDCSGLVTQSLFLAGGPDLRATHNCAQLITECQRVEAFDYCEGLLAFYGFLPRVPDHVMVLKAADGDRHLTAYGACGGNHYTLTIADAIRIKAKVQERSRINYRHDFLGCYKWDRLSYG